MEAALRARDVARLLDIPESTVFLLWRRGELRAFKCGRHLRTRPEWLREFQERQEIAKPESADATR